MTVQLARVEGEIRKIEDVILERATSVLDLNHFLGFCFSYLSAYLPLLEYAAEVLPENSLARLANFGMLVDHVSSIQLDRALSVQMDRQAKEISDVTGRPKTQVLTLLQEMTVGQKAYLSTALLATSSLSRDLLLCSANSRFNALNKIVTWANVFSNVIHMPAFAELFITPEMFEEAISDLADAQRRIQLRSREYDYDLAKDWSEVLGMSPQRLQEIPKFFPGAKLTWLMAMEGLETARYIATRAAEAGKSALAYNSKMIRLLRNREIGIDEWSYRRLNSPGPCIDIKTIVDLAANGSINLVPITSQTLFVRSASRQFFVHIPGIFSFYTNPNMVVRISKDIAIPLAHEVGAIVAFYKNPAGFVASNIKALSKPWESDLLERKIADRKKIEWIIAEGASIRVHINLTLSGPVNQYLVDFVGQITETSFQGALLYGLLFSIEKIAEASGIAVPDNLWAGARMAMAAALLSRLRGVTTTAKAKTDEEDRESRKRISEATVPATSDERISALYQKIEESETEMRKSFEELKDAGLTDILDIMTDIRRILLGGFSPDETVERLKAYCESVSGGPNITGQHEKEGSALDMGHL